MLRVVLALLAFSAFHLPSAQVRMTRVDEVALEVTLRNFGPTETDVSGYWMCRAPGTYQQVSSLALVGGTDLSLSPGEEVTLVYGQIPAQGGIGLYLNASGFGSSANIADYVQWGGVAGVRESVAVGAGIWTAGTFAAGASGPFVYTGSGTQNGADFWSAITGVPVLPTWAAASLGVLLAGAAGRRLRRRA